MRDPCGAWCHPPLTEPPRSHRQGSSVAEGIPDHSPLIASGRTKTAPWPISSSSPTGSSSSGSDSSSSSSSDGSQQAPAGTTAPCNDGSYSYSAHRRGTCSHHGGVAVWLASVPS
ncbi:DUF3761 domain-containing protein [Streptomyces sp. NPDC059695]|uniref:DUF3761 domain-containing protein n=1 Tax=Streptomyces sp. NPDC059695 TaxID=3346910 RepID=UPI0036B37C3A